MRKGRSLPSLARTVPATLGLHLPLLHSDTNLRLSGPHCSPHAPPPQEMRFWALPARKWKCGEPERAPATLNPARHDGGSGDRARMGADGTTAPEELTATAAVSGAGAGKEGACAARGLFRAAGPRPLSGPASCLRRPRRCLSDGRPRRCLRHGRPRTPAGLRKRGSGSRRALSRNDHLHAWPVHATFIFSVSRRLT